MGGLCVVCEQWGMYRKVLNLSFYATINDYSERNSVETSFDKIEIENITQMCKSKINKLKLSESIRIKLLNFELY